MDSLPHMPAKPCLNIRWGHTEAIAADGGEGARATWRLGQAM